MATQVERYLDVGGAGTQDGTSLANAYPDWHTALEDIKVDYPNFITSDVYVTLYCTGGLDSDGGTVALDMTMDSTRYLEVVPYQTADQNFTGIYDDSYYTLESTRANDTGVAISGDAYVIFDGIQFSSNNTGSTTYNIILRATGNSTLLVRNFRAKFNGVKDSTPPGGDSADHFIRNNGADLILGDNGVVEGFYTGIRHNTSSANFRYTNTLIKDCDFTHTLGSTGRPAIINCILHDNTSVPGTNEWHPTSDYNSTTDSSTPTNFGSNSLTNQSVTFVNEAGGDYRLNASDTDLHSAGIGTTEPKILSEDINGVSRGVSTASMGPYEYVATSSNLPSYHGANRGILRGIKRGVG